ncbi:hypothetical protein ACO2Q9_04935 [Variovorax sp. VNK109]|uniref:hypothetical protein n=1 Tax=Variovorax sp. VNK109 TaxID=3400919 RepID=UPI003C079D15
MIWSYVLRLRYILGVLLCAHAHFSLAQQVYLCKGADGQQQYQQAPCGQGAEVGSAWSKQREVERAREEARQAELAKLQAARAQKDAQHRRSNIDGLRTCKQGRDCDIESVRMMMTNLSRDDLMTALGPPETVQKVGDELWYYSITAEDAGARRNFRLQISFRYNDDDHSRRPYQSVWKVNVY